MGGVCKSGAVTFNSANLFSAPVLTGIPFPVCCSANSPHRGMEDGRIIPYLAGPYSEDRGEE